MVCRPRVVSCRRRAVGRVAPWGLVSGVLVDCSNQLWSAPLGATPIFSSLQTTLWGAPETLFRLCNWGGPDSVLVVVQFGATTLQKFAALCRWGFRRGLGGGNLRNNDPPGAPGGVVPAQCSNHSVFATFDICFGGRQQCATRTPPGAPGGVIVAYLALRNHKICKSTTLQFYSNVCN